MKEPQIHVVRWQPMRILFKKANRVSLPGFDGLTLYDVGKQFVQQVSTMKLQERTAAVTYNFLMALPPTLLFLFSLVPYLPLKNVEQAVLNVIKLLTPNQKIYQNVRDVFNDFMHKQHHDVLSFGIVLVLFFSSNGMMGLMRSFDHSLTVYKKRTGLQRRWTAIKLTLILITVTIVSLSVFIIQSKRLNFFLLHTFHNVAIVKLVSFVFLVLVIFVAISIMYTYGPSLKYRFRFVSAGSVFATCMSIVVTSVFFFLVNNLFNYNKFYGSIGSLIAFMVWMWLNTAIILLGYELNVSILTGKLSEEDEQPEA